MEKIKKNKKITKETSIFFHNYFISFSTVFFVLDIQSFIIKGDNLEIYFHLSVSKNVGLESKLLIRKLVKSCTDKISRIYEKRRCIEINPLFIYSNQ